MPETISIEKSSSVDAPVWRVYGYWGRAENFPKFMPTVLEVRQVAKNRLCWHESIDGKTHETLVEVNALASGQCGFAWKSISGPKHWGTIQFEAQAHVGTTLIQVQMEYVPEPGSPTAQALAKKVEGDLRSFKRFVEAEQKKKSSQRTSVHRSDTSTADR